MIYIYIRLDVAINKKVCEKIWINKSREREKVYFVNINQKTGLVPASIPLQILLFRKSEDWKSKFFCINDLIFGKISKFALKSFQISDCRTLRLSESNLVLKSLARKVSSWKTFLIRKRKKGLVIWTETSQVISYIM